MTGRSAAAVRTACFLAAFGATAAQAQTYPTRSVEIIVPFAAGGHTLLISSVGLAANPLLYKRLPFDTLNDLAPITLIASSPTILVVPQALPVNTLAELIAQEEMDRFSMVIRNANIQLD